MGYLKRRPLILEIAFYLFVAVASVGSARIVSQKSVPCDDPKLKKMWEDAVKKHPLPENATELINVRSFPDETLVEENIFLWMPIDIAMNNRHEIFVLDQKRKHMFQFDRSGRFIRTIGRKGQGPGEMNIPFCVCCSNEYIYVIDNSNRNIQKYSFDGIFFSSKKILRSYSDIAWDPAGFLYAAPLGGIQDVFLIDVFPIRVISSNRSSNRARRSGNY